MGERWKNANEIEPGDAVRPLGMREFSRVKHVWVEGDTVTVTTTDNSRLPILAPEERVEIDPQA